MEAEIDDYREHRAYQDYITETLRLKAENKYIQTPFKDILDPPPVDTRTGEEVAQDVVEELGITIK